MRLVNAEHIVRDVFVIAASAGGVEASLALVAALLNDLPARVFLVIHRSPVQGSQLAAVLQRRSGLPVIEPSDGDVALPGTIYQAPRDRHMTIADARIALHRGPKQHFTRP